MSTPIVLGDQGLITYTVTNHGGAPATVTFRLDGTSHATTKFWVFQAAVNDQSQTCKFMPWTLPVTCTRQLAAGSMWQITVMANAISPGTLDLDASIATENGDDDPTDDRLATTIGAQCSIQGTPGNDVLTVRKGESACGNGGNDVFFAKGDGTGVFGGPGTDTLYEEHGITKYWLGDGTDTLSLALSRNPVYICAKATGRWTSGGRASPEDGAAYGYGADIIVGSPYRDVIKGNRYNDVIFGGGGRDIINPGRGDDAVFAGRGDDQIISQDGQRDDIVGGTGSDRAKADSADNVTSAAVTHAALIDLVCNG